VASWIPDNWNDKRLDAEHRADEGDIGAMRDLWNQRLGPQPVIPGGRQVPVVYREPIPAKYFTVKEAPQQVVSDTRLICAKCGWESEDPEFCSFCGQIRRAA
jgi:hypothetical protein